MLDCRESIVRLGDASVESQSMCACQTLRSGGEAGRFRKFRRGRKPCRRFPQKRRIRFFFLLRTGGARIFPKPGLRIRLGTTRVGPARKTVRCSGRSSRQRAGSSKFSQDVPPKIPVTVRWGDGTKVRGMTELSKEAGIGRRSLCRALSACRARCQPLTSGRIPRPTEPYGPDSFCNRLSNLCWEGWVRRAIVFAKEAHSLFLRPRTADGRRALFEEKCLEIQRHLHRNAGARRYAR